MVCSVQTVHLSCTNTNTLSKQTKTRSYTTHVTYEFHWARLKLFMSLWYVQCKPCTYFALRLAQSPNGPNKAPPDPCHLGVPSGAPKMIYEPMVRYKPSTYLAPMLTLSQNRSKRDSTRHTSPRSSIGCLQYYFRAYGTFDANCAPILHLELHYLQTDRTMLPLVPRHLGVPLSAF
jgi:hypothetical protein